MSHEETLDVHDASEDLDGEAGRGGGSEACERFAIGDVVHYYHHHDARKPMAALVIHINQGENQGEAGEPESYTLKVFTRTGGGFPAYDVKCTPTGRTGHFFRRKP